MTYKKNGVSLLMVVLVLSSLCGSKRKPMSVDPVTAIKITTNIPLVLEGELINNTDSLLLFYSGENILYITPYAHYIQHIILDKNRNFVREEDTTVIQYRYFIYNRHEKYGIRGDSLTWQGSRSMGVDSFLSTYGASSCGIDDDFFRDYELFDSLQNGNELELRFKRKMVVERDFADSAYLYYANRLQQVSYSLSTQRDLINNRKLYKIRGIHNGRYNKEHAAFLPKREFWITMEPFYIQSPEKIAAFFEAFKNRK